MSLFPKPFTIERVSRALVRGVYVDGAPQSITFTGSNGGTVQPLTGEDIATMPDEMLRQRIAKVGVCARIMPEQKLRLVELLKELIPLPTEQKRSRKPARQRDRVVYQG